MGEHKEFLELILLTLTIIGQIASSLKWTVKKMKKLKKTWRRFKAK